MESTIAGMVFGGLDKAVDSYREACVKAGNKPGRAMCSYFIFIADDDKAEGIAAGRIKAAFAGYRAGIEKQRKALVPWGVAVGVNKGDDGWDGHHVYIQPQDLEVRKEAIARAKNMQAKAKKPAKKAAAKKRSAA